MPRTTTNAIISFSDISQASTSAGNFDRMSEHYSPTSPSNKTEICAIKAKKAYIRFASAVCRNLISKLPKG
jgi:hypothetical protein